MLCRRSASLMSTTRMSSTMASIILRRFSACCSSRVAKSIWLILVTPSTMCATCSPNSLRMSTMVTEVSSTESCSRPAAIATGSIFISASTSATPSGMHEVRLAGGAGLSGMMFLRIFVGFPHQLQIVVGPVGAHGAHQLAELGHREGGGRDLFAQSRHNGLYRGKRRWKQRLYRP